MRSLAALCALALLACSPAAEGTSGPGPSEARPAAGDAAAASASPAASAKDEAPIDREALEAAGGVGYFAGGCFWGVEHFLEQMDGVLRVESGYMGGHLDSPSYEQVVAHESGHLEAVRVYFDPQRIAYKAVAKRFFEIHDPTQADGQGPDIGEQYRSAVFVTGAEQREVVEGLIAQLRTRGYDVVTQIRSADTFWPAEEYHQNYYEKKGGEPYCHARVKRFED